MADDKKTKEDENSEAVSLVNKETGEIMDIDALTASLDNMKPGLEITGEYIEFEVDKEYKMFVIGSQKMKAIKDSKEKSDTNEYIDAIRFLSRDGQFFINADAVVRSTLFEHTNRGPYPVSILCTGKKGDVGRQYKTFKIHPLG